MTGRHLALAALFALAGCDDYLWNAPESGGIGDATGYCAVQQIAASKCASCHGSSAPAAGLDLATDPHAAMVGVASSQYPSEILVVAGDPAASFLVEKVTGPSPDHGGKMPPGGELPQAEVDAISAWISDGAPSECDETFTAQRYHPDGWADPGAHGLGAKLQTEADCRTCHGDDLTGGSTGISCDGCHTEGWRETCTFCHGGELDTTGAPPEDIDDQSDPASISFPQHVVHVNETIHTAWDCTTCHVKPDNVLFAGHLFDDDTAGVAEVVLGGGLGAGGSYSPGTCSDVYCHGTGQTPGDVSIAAFASSCDGCHPDASSGENRWESMSGDHEDHLDEGAVCADCHGAVVSRQQDVLDPALHVNGTPDVRLPAGMSFTGTTCTGTCHLGDENEQHNARNW
jgi:predicted CxxxxCH...CXXCH cytochrome family protein